MIEAGAQVNVAGAGKWARMNPWVVIKVNQMTYKLKHEATGQILNAGKHMVVEASDRSTNATYDGTSTRLPKRPEGLRTGAVVTTKGILAGFPPETLFVVIKDDFDTVNLVPLGGDEKRRYWKVTAWSLEVIDLVALATRARQN